MNGKEQNLHTPENNLDGTDIIKINHPSASTSYMEFNSLTDNNKSKDGQKSPRKRKLDKDSSPPKGCTRAKIPRILHVDCMKNQPQQAQKSTPKNKKGLIDVKINITCNDCQLSFLSLQKFWDHFKINAELKIKENIPPKKPKSSLSSKSPTRKRKTKATNNPNRTPPTKTKSKSRSTFKCNENVTSESYPNPISFNSEIETKDETEIKSEYSDEEETEIKMDHSPWPENTDGDNHNDNDPLSPSPLPPPPASSSKPKRKQRPRKNVVKKSVTQSSSSKGEAEPESESICEKCGKSFSRKQCLNRHLQIVHLRPLVCPIESCEKSYGSKKHLERHIRSHSTELPFKCPECPRAFKQPEDLKRHSLVHTVPDGLPFKCPVANCSAAYSLALSLWEHKKHKHPPSGIIEKPHKCTWPGCSYSFFKNIFLKYHMISHTDERPFKCEVEGCGSTFKARRTLSNHMVIHSGQRPFSCEVEGCGATFQTTNHLRQHGAVHSKEFNHLCELCGKSFKTNGGLRQHEAHVHPETSQDPKPPKISLPKNFPCDHSGCGRFFSTLTRLTNHQKLHENNASQMQHQNNPK